LPHPDEQGNRRTFSIAGSHDDGLKFLVATRARGSGFKRALVEAPIGTDLEVRGPYGYFTLPEEPANIVMLAGGIGVTPFRAMVQDARERSLDHTLSLIHSNRTPEEAPFLDELIRWGVESANETMTNRERRKRERQAARIARGAETGGTHSAAGPSIMSTRPAAGTFSGGSSSGVYSTVDDPRSLGPAVAGGAGAGREPAVSVGGVGGAAGAVGAVGTGRGGVIGAGFGPRFRYVPIMTRADGSKRGWDGERRRLSPEVLREALGAADMTAPIFYVAGPPRFVEGALESLHGAGVEKSRIRAEEFPGY
jgi:ferredoxin-NADP reductase